MSGSTSQASFSLAGFQVTIIGRFWVTAEDWVLRQTDADKPIIVGHATEDSAILAL
jgi:hypothetical protein